MEGQRFWIGAEGLTDNCQLGRIGDGKDLLPLPWGKRSKDSLKAFLNRTGSRWAKEALSVTTRASAPVKVLQ